MSHCIQKQRLTFLQITQKDTESSNDACAHSHIITTNDTEDPRLLSAPDKLPESLPPTTLSCTAAGGKTTPLTDQVWVGDTTQSTRHSKKPRSSNSSAPARQTTIDFTLALTKLKKRPEPQGPMVRLHHIDLTSSAGQEGRPSGLETFQFRAGSQLSCEDSPSPQESTSPAEQDFIVVKPLPEDTGIKKRGHGRQLRPKNKPRVGKRKATEPLSSKATRRKTTHP
jgi:hypothetical protein